MGNDCISKTKEEDQKNQEVKKSSSQVIAEQMKEKGNEMYKKQQFSDAITYYTNAIVRLQFRNIGTKILFITLIELNATQVKNSSRTVLMTAKWLIKLMIKIQRDSYDNLLLMRKQEGKKKVQNILYMLCIILTKICESKKDEVFLNQILEYKKKMLKLYQVIKMNVLQKEKKELKEYFEPIFYDLRLEEGVKNEYEEILQSMFELNQQIEPPRYLCCSISLDLMRDPVCSPDGIQYERANLIESMCKLGWKEPITKKQFSREQIVDNKGIKNAIAQFLSDQPFAYDYEGPVDIKSLDFE